MTPARYPFLASPSRRPGAAALTVALFAILALLPALAGCAMQTGIVGHWGGSTTSGVTTTTYEAEFHSDGTYSETVDVRTSDNSQPDKSNTYRGTFTADKYHLNLNPTETVDNFEASSYSGSPLTYGYKLRGQSLIIYGGNGPIILTRHLW